MLMQVKWPKVLIGTSVHAPTPTPRGLRRAHRRRRQAQKAAARTASRRLSCPTMLDTWWPLRPVPSGEGCGCTTACSLLMGSVASERSAAGLPGLSDLPRCESCHGWRCCSGEREAPALDAAAARRGFLHWRGPLRRGDAYLQGGQQQLLHRKQPT